MPQWDLAGSWSYSGDPAKSDLDWARWTIGDTDSTDKLASNEEILAALASDGRTGAAASICNALSARFARYADEVISQPGGASIQRRLSARSAAFAALSARLLTESLQYAAPYSGGQSVRDKATNEANTDLVQPQAKRDMFDFPGALNPQSETS